MNRDALMRAGRAWLICEALKAFRARDLNRWALAVLLRQPAGEERQP